LNLYESVSSIASCFANPVKLRATFFMMLAVLAGVSGSAAIRPNVAANFLQSAALGAAVNLNSLDMFGVLSGSSVYRREAKRLSLGVIGGL
jgi:hypothetical protein